MLADNEMLSTHQHIRRSGKGRVNAYTRDGFLLTFVEFRFIVGDYQVRAGVNNDVNSWSYTPWVTLTDGPHSLEIDWHASSAPGANNGGLTFWVDDVQQGSFTNIDNDTRWIDSVNFGAVEGVDNGTRGTYYFDAFESRRETYIGLAPGAPEPPPPAEKTDALFADGFESGSFSAWSANVNDGGDLSVSAQAVITGTYGLKAVIDDNVSIYVTDWRPWDETTYRARFYFDPNSIPMSNNDSHFIFYALNRDGIVIARVEFRYSSTVYQVRAETINDTNGWHSSSWVTISDAPHYLEILWQAATAPGANNGVFTFWVDGAQQATFTNLDSDTRRVDYAQLGAVGWLDNGTRGTYYFDAFESRRTSYIGPVASSLRLPVVRLAHPDLTVLGSGLSSLVAWVQSLLSRLAAGLEQALTQSVWVGEAAGMDSASIRPDEVESLRGTLLSPENKPEAAPGVRGAASATTTTITYAYDPLYRLKRADYSDGTYFQYAYDAVGNRLSEETTGGTVNSYTYDIANRLTGLDGMTYTWDNNGNLLTDGVHAYSYNHANRLVGVDGPATDASYSYNGLGDRLQQTVGGATTDFTLDITSSLSQVLTDGTDTYLYGNGRIAQHDAAGAQYFLGDALGSVRQLTDATGVVTWMQSYQPYGEKLTSAGSGSTNYGFTGEWSDPSGLIFLRARHYSPTDGRFIGRDRWEGDINRPMSYNGWLYGYNNPLVFTDPSGQTPISNCPDPNPDGSCTPFPPPPPPPDTINFNETIPPAGISWFPGANSPTSNMYQGYVKYDGVIANYSKPILPGTSGAQFKIAPKWNGLCGPIAVSAILRATSPDISANILLAQFERIGKSPDWMNYTDLRDAINGSYGEYWSAQANYVTGFMGGDNETVNEWYNSLAHQLYTWMRSGHYVIPTVKADGSTGRLQGGSEHWIAITGMSQPWRWGDTVEDYRSPRNWIRIFNPLDNQTEYYPWYYFREAWEGQSHLMVLMLKKADVPLVPPSRNRCD